MHIPPACITCGDPTIGAVGPVFLAWRQHVMAQHFAATGTHPAHALTDARLRPKCLEDLLPDHSGPTPARRVRTKTSKLPAGSSSGDGAAPASANQRSANQRSANEPSPTDSPAERAAAIFPECTPFEPIFEALGIDAPCCRACISATIPLEYVV